MLKKCIICDNEFESKRHGTKTCSDECRKKHNNNRRQRTNLNHLSTFNCKVCGKEVTRYRIRSGFCGRSCASNFYLKNGTFDKWKNHKNPKKGIDRNCLICGKLFYVKPHDIHKSNEAKFCSKECLYKHLSIYFKGENNPSFGKKESEQSKIKKKSTLISRYGVTNAYFLCKRKKTSKQQIELFNVLKNIFPTHNIVKEKRLKNGYYADILFADCNIIVEYNGSYWHCDPRIYDKNYYNKKKQLLAQDIWNSDENRLKKIKKEGYDVFVIWEKDFLENRDIILNETRRIVLDGKKNKDNDARRSSIDLVDVKLGELLETS